MQSITFAAGVYVILQGCGWSSPKSCRPSRDLRQAGAQRQAGAGLPHRLPLRPNAVLIGFLSSFAAGLVGMVLLYLLGLTVIIPGVVPHFFVGAAAGCSAMPPAASWRPAGAFANGLLITFLPVFLLPVLGISALPTPPSAMPTSAWWGSCLA